MNMNTSNPGFVPITMDRYIELHLKANPDDTRENIESALRHALRDKKAGVSCRCGNPIWVIGSAIAGTSCFTCITGEAAPEREYEIDEAM